MAAIEEHLTGWKTSSRSAGDNCVEVCIGDDGVRIRDTKDRSGPVLTVSREAWQAFLDGVRNGEFDQL